MNEYEGDPLLDIPGYQQLITYRSYEQKLKDEIELGSFDSELQKNGYHDALEIVLQGIDHVLSDPGFQDATAELGISACQEIREIETSTDVNPDEHNLRYKNVLLERVDTIKAIFETQTSITEVSQEFIAVSAGGLAVSQSVEHCTEPNDRFEKEVNTIPIELSINEDYLKIGDHGKRIKLTSRHHEKQRDYTEYRARAIKYLVKNQDREVAPNEIWEAAFGTTKAFDKEEMQHIRSWLLKISYRNKPIVQINGKRGLGSRFFISKEFDVVVEDKRKKIRSLSKELHKPDEITLQSGHCYEVSKKLYFIRGELESRGFSSISKESVLELSKMKDYDAEDIVKYKKQATIAIQTLIKDRKKLAKAKDEYDSASPEYQSLTYLETLLNEGMEDNLLSQLVGYKILEHGQGVDLLDESGMLIWEGIIVGGVDNESKADDQDSSKELRLRPRLGGDRAVVTGREIIQINRVSKRGTNANKRKSKTRDTAEETNKLADFETFTYRIVEQFVSAEMLPDKLYTSGMIRSILPSFTKRVIYLADRAGIFGKGNPDKKEFYLEDVIRVLANASGAQKSYFNNSVVKKDVEETIQKAIASASKVKDE